MPKVHKGYIEGANGREIPTAWVETSLLLEPDVNDLINGLGSKFFRDESIPEEHSMDRRPEDLPEVLTQAQILRVYRNEYSHWGSANLGTWTDFMGAERQECVMRWLTTLVVAAFPEMKDYVWEGVRS